MRHRVRRRQDRWLEARHTVISLLDKGLDEIHAALWEHYRAAGSPYGESDEEMQRFMREEWSAVPLPPPHLRRR